MTPISFYCYIVTSRLSDTVSDITTELLLLAGNEVTVISSLGGRSRLFLIKDSKSATLILYSCANDIFDLS